MRFQPKFCPRPDCPAHSGSGFACQRRGCFSRRCDRRIVPRFHCLSCRRGFSMQTFRLDYRLKRPDLLVRFFLDRISKVTHRQSARTLECSRTTEERHFRLLSAHCREFHEAWLSAVTARGGLGTRFVFDEMETYEQHRTQKPVTMPVLIERHSGFVLEVQAGSMVPRGPRRQGEKRRSESLRVVRRSFKRLAAFAQKRRTLLVDTDEKTSYRKVVRDVFGERCRHRRTSSREVRDMRNPLWPVNHTCARLRDGVSRLVRETWAAAKKRRWLRGHAAIWICYRNYVRGRTNKQPRLTPAMALGLHRRRFKPPQLLRYRVFERV